MVFNRPDTTERVFEAIRQVRPPRLYVAADGPRLDKEGEANEVQVVRDHVMRNIDWDCQIQTLFRDTNLGCRKAVGEAITWFFEHEEAGIILEDDCLPDPSFFLFCAELLLRYKDNAQIMSISGDCFHKQGFESGVSYSFSIYQHIWGWATWRRAWRHYDSSLANRPCLFDFAWLRNLLGSDGAARYWSSIISRYHDGLIDTWDFPWLFSCWINNGLSIVPAVNLVANIGFDSRATHTKQSDSSFAVCPSAVMRFPLLHPPVVRRNISIERSSEKMFLPMQGKPEKSSSLMAKAKARLSRLLTL
jgi:hypothetical protein